MNDFIFGTLSTEEQRQARELALHAGVTHAQNRQPLDPLPEQPITLTLTVGPAFRVERAWVYWTTDGSDPLGSNGGAVNGYATPLEPVNDTWSTLLWGYIRAFQVALPGQPAGSVVRYRLSITTPAGEVFADQGAYFGIYIDDDPLPDWTRDALVYQIFPDRFNPGEGRDWQQPDTLSGIYGGRLVGITERLDEIAELGFNAVWLTPIHPSPSHHGYDTLDLFEVEPRLGSQADLRRLLDEAHRLGMRVLLDIVPNHLSNRHPVFEGAVSDPASLFREWFTFRRYPDEYETFFGVRSLPQLNLRHPAARQHVLDAAAHWLDFGVDGFRVDYAIGPSADFWADFRRVTRAHRADCWTFGEVVDPPDTQRAFSGLLDGCLDFMLLEAMRQTFGFGVWSASQFASFLDRHERYFPPDFSRPSFLDNHDMNRFLWAAGGDQARLRLAALVQYTLNGPPVVYYGTEVGLSQTRDVRQGERGVPEESRLPMLWDDQQDTALRAYYHRLGALRAGSVALRRGERIAVHASADTLAYERRLGAERRLVAANLSDEPRLIPLERHWGKIVEASGAGCRLERTENGVILLLPPLMGVVIRND